YIKGGVWSCLLLVLGIQMASLYTSGNMVIPLTLSNLGEYNAIGSILLLKLIVIVFSFFITSLLFILVQIILALSLLVS
ncbi:hypothetical protein KDV34_21950, partial [Citrobacter portucalensis]|uniref:hypothetical protein n=1 Tax=Citrobacter portucalensis TaxID=1639133 RepID=UPI0033506783